MKASKITAIEFFDDLTSSHARRIFFWGFLLLCGICAFFIYLTSQLLAAGTLRDVLLDVLNEIFASAVVIIAFYWIYVYFIGINPILTEVSVTRPQDISERMKSLPLGTTRYMLWGRAGSYFRAYPLLKLDEQARAEKKNIDIEIVLPDPNDPRLSNSYNQIVQALGEEPNKHTLLANVLATSIACAIIAANNKFINVRIYYSKFLPAFRVDLSDNGAILTQDAPSKSALFFEADSEFYEMFRTTVRNEMAISREAKWNNDLFKELTLSEKSCNKDTLSAFGIVVDDVDELQRYVGKLVAKRPHRYK
jgi:hypothetical protein